MLLTKFSKTLLPVKPCASFTKDQSFERSRETLRKEGIEWTQLTKSGSETSVAAHFIYAEMDHVFFHPDKFEVLIDARGFRPEDLKCTMTQNVVEVIGQRVENLNSTNRSMSLTRNYQLPQPVKPEEGCCCLSSEGVLLITAPWFK